MTEEKKLSLAQRMGITRTTERPREQSDIQLREDRIGRYFRKYLDKFVFVELSDAYLEKSKVRDIMKGVPIPLRKRDLKSFDGGSGIEPTVIAENIAWVMGCDPHFKYNKAYVEYLLKIFNPKIYEGMLREGRDAAEREDYDNACIHFRASLCMKYDYLHGMYSYARVCRAMYLASEDTEYVGRFKAEALDWFELLTETHPRFAQGYYYLGYAYLNIGLYAKAQIAWKWFLSFSHNGKDRREITKRMKQIEDPVTIEAGCNEIASGRFEEGVKTLEPYLSSRFNTWWPLHYYLGVGYANTSRIPDAVARFRHTLTLNASHIQTMQELLAIYRAQNDKENIKKYESKIKMVEEGLAEEEREAARKAEKTARKRPLKNTSSRKTAKSNENQAARGKSSGAADDESGKDDGSKRTKSGIKRLH